MRKVTIPFKLKVNLVSCRECMYVLDWFLVCLSAASVESVGGSVPALWASSPPAALEFALERHHLVEKNISVLGCNSFCFLMCVGISIVWD